MTSWLYVDIYMKCPVISLNIYMSHSTYIYKYAVALLDNSILAFVNFTKLICITGLSVLEPKKHC